MHNITAKTNQTDLVDLPDAAIFLPPGQISLQCGQRTLDVVLNFLHQFYDIWVNCDVGEETEHVQLILPVNLLWWRF